MDGAEQLIMQTRETIGSLRAVQANLLAFLEELESELAIRKEE